MFGSIAWTLNLPYIGQELYKMSLSTNHNGTRRRSGLMVSVLNSRSGGPGLSPGRGHCVVFLGKTLYSHSASLHPGVQMGTSTSKYAGNNPVMD